MEEVSASTHGGSVSSAEPSSWATQSLPVPYVTYTIIAFCGVIFSYFNLARSTSSYESIASLLVPSVYQIWNGAYWAFIIPVFVHFGLMHFLFNMWWAKDFGKYLEPTMGRRNYVLLILAAAAIGSGVQLAFSNQTGIGYSGVLYALFGYALAARGVVPLYRSLLTPKTVGILLIWLVVCIVLTATKVWMIANGAHIGGFVFGYCVGKAFVARTHVIISLTGITVLTVLTILSAVYAPWSSYWPYRTIGVKYENPREVAEAGDAEAQFWYGEKLLQMQGRKAEALQWLRKSAEHGDAEAMNALAWQESTDLVPTKRCPTDPPRSSDSRH